MWFDKFADWVAGQNFITLGFIGLVFAFLFSAILKTAWGTWWKRDDFN